MATQNTRPTEQSAPQTDSALPPPQKNGRLYVFTAFGILAVLVLTLTAIYREGPRRTAIAKRNRTPAVQGVYTVVLSPLDSATARAYTSMIVDDIGADSLATKMVVGSTHVARQLVTLSDFRSSLFDAFVQARPANLRVQGALMTNIANSIVGDKLPSTLYIIGDLGSTDFSAVEARFADVFAALQIRNQTIGPLHIVSYPASGSASEGGRAVRTRFLNTFRQRGLDVREGMPATAQVQ